MLFFTFFVIPETAGVAWTDLTSFWQPSLVSPLPWRISRNKIKLKHRYHVINKDGRLARETNDCKTRDLKTSITQLFFQENLKNYLKFIITVKYAPKMYHVAMVVHAILWDIVNVTQSLTKNKGKNNDAHKTL